MSLLKKQIPEQKESLSAKSVHSMLSQRQRAYSVFPPAQTSLFHLFQVITVLADPRERPRSPRNTVVNLKHTLEHLRQTLEKRGEEDQSWIDAFMSEFKHTGDGGGTSSPHPQEAITVSEESLYNAGVALLFPAGFHFRFGASRTRFGTRQLRLQDTHSEAYGGGPQLRSLIWKNAKAIFPRILQHLGSECPSEPNECCLLAVVTKRIISTVGVSKSAGKRWSFNIGAGNAAGSHSGTGKAENQKVIQEEYDNIYGVSGLHFIVFPVKCMKRNKWRCYRGIDVCDSDVNDELFTSTTRIRDSFYQAQKWVLGEIQLADDSDSEKVPKTAALEAGVLRGTTDSTNISPLSEDKKDITRQVSPLDVDIGQTSFTADWVDIDIERSVDEFSEGQCQIASHIRKTASHGTPEQDHVVSLLRSALRKGRFESFIRALYDLSICYREGVAVKIDLGMGKLLGYCAGNLRRKYGSRDVWLPRLALELRSFPQEAAEQRITLHILSGSPSLSSRRFRGDNMYAQKMITAPDSPMNQDEEEGAGFLVHHMPAEASS